jgi:hypothetical protein
VFDECKASNTLIVYENTKARVKRPRTPMAQTNSFACPKVKFHPSQCEGGAIGVKSKLGKIINTNKTKDKAAT